MSKIVVLGNSSPKETHRLDTGALRHRSLDMPKAETEFHFPDDRKPLDALREIQDAFCGHDSELEEAGDDPGSNPNMGYHSDASPAWVAGDEQIAAMVAAQYNCPIGVPKSWRKLRVSAAAKSAIGVKLEEGESVED